MVWEEVSPSPSRLEGMGSVKLPAGFGPKLYFVKPECQRKPCGGTYFTEFVTSLGEAWPLAPTLIHSDGVASLIQRTAQKRKNNGKNQNPSSS